MLRGSLGLSILLSCSTVLPDRAQAQESESGNGLEEVVVTARKRTENAQDVPIAITAMSDSKLKELGADNMGELV
jgi:iron complex outermembrane recepter protein